MAIGRGALEKREITLKNGRAAEIARRLQALHQLPERHLLVIECIERSASDLLHHLQKFRIARKVGSDRYRVGKIADHPGKLRRTSGGRASDNQVLLPRVAMEQRDVGGQQRVVQRRLMRARENTELRRELLRYADEVRRSGEAEHSGSGLINRQSQ